MLELRAFGCRGPYNIINRPLIRLMDKILHDLRYLNYGIDGAILCLGHAEFCPSTVFPIFDWGPVC